MINKKSHMKLGTLYTSRLEARKREGQGGGGGNKKKKRVLVVLGSKERVALIAFVCLDFRMLGVSPE